MEAKIQKKAKKKHIRRCYKKRWPAQLISLHSESSLIILTRCCKQAEVRGYEIGIIPSKLSVPDGTKF